MSTELPRPLAEIRDDFLELSQQDRLQLLLEFSDELPALPERLQGHEDELERVEECQSPVFITVTVGAEGDAPDVVRMHATAPREAPTTRGFASILAQGLSGLSAPEVLAVPVDYPLTLGLTEAVSPLRIRGMVGMLGRVQRQVQAAAAD
ncbi:MULTISPECIES: SufE family protein [unclassified Curtobacterium]|uniref:SufE family protein n=1 Tax=unclassified Curtobacterium TaxID=257496 RepID=UPI0020422C65|nr:MULTISPECIES: SufE family protein [unclassified Curtobacterium]MCM3521721.1 SufE family protein [Curtobacterium sp. P97]MDP9736963.1 cysteine desulfuration protein SufE [Curtobacterium sp. 260]